MLKPADLEVTFRVAGVETVYLLTFDAMDPVPLVAYERWAIASTSQPDTTDAGREHANLSALCALFDEVFCNPRADGSQITHADVNRSVKVKATSMLLLERETKGKALSPASRGTSTSSSGDAPASGPRTRSDASDTPRSTLATDAPSSALAASA